MAITPEMMAVCRRLFEDFAYYAENAVMIRTKDQQFIKLTLNRAQRPKDYEFSRHTMEEHWKACYNDTVRVLRHPGVLERPVSPDGILAFDISEDGGL
jgi:hypothetical protein